MVKYSTPHHILPDGILGGGGGFDLKGRRPPISESPAAGCIKAELHAARVGIPDGGSGLN